MSFNSWTICLFILTKIKTEFEESDYTMIKSRLMKNITSTVTEYQLQKVYF